MLSEGFSLTPHHFESMSISSPITHLHNIICTITAALNYGHIANKYTRIRHGNFTRKFTCSGINFSPLWGWQSVNALSDFV